MKLSHLLLLLFLAISCTPATEDTAKQVDRYEQIADEKAREIIRASIEHAGGMERWEQMQQLRYTKDFSLLLESGEVEKSYEQVHDYQYNPMVIDIQSQENGQLIHTLLQEGVYSRTIDGESADLSQDVLAKAVNTSTYVVGMPFKLLDPGVDITYEGGTQMEDGRMVDVIRVSYDADQHDNHSTTDVWKYYFDKEDRKIVANWVKTSDHFSLVENVSFVRAGGILFNKERKSYRVDSLGQRLWLRAEYVYDNYEVQ
jgi:hypothetical protein